MSVAKNILSACTAAVLLSACGPKLYDYHEMQFRAHHTRSAESRDSAQNDLDAIRRDRQELVSLSEQIEAAKMQLQTASVDCVKRARRLGARP